jgi:hypothetical protein
VAWILLAAFSQDYSGNHKQKSKAEGFEKHAIYPEKE